jgi:hypothetical protein
MPPQFPRAQTYAEVKLSKSASIKHIAGDRFGYLLAGYLTHRNFSAYPDYFLRMLHATDAE